VRAVVVVTGSLVYDLYHDKNLFPVNLLKQKRKKFYS
tara:strand:+ start:352 stop:462 length:111 start_codon:yes stop_codon:yes gene_type:complete